MTSRLFSSARSRAIPEIWTMELQPFPPSRSAPFFRSQFVPHGRRYLLCGLTTTRFEREHSIRPVASAAHNFRLVDTTTPNLGVLSHYRVAQLHVACMSVAWVGRLGTVPPRATLDVILQPINISGAPFHPSFAALRARSPLRRRRASAPPPSSVPRCRRRHRLPRFPFS